MGSTMAKSLVEHRLLFGVKLVMVAVFGIGLYAFYKSFLPSDNDNSAGCSSVAAYKEKLKVADSPLSPRPPELVTQWLSRIIDCDLEAGDKKSARTYVRQAIDRNLDGAVLEKVTSEQSKVLITATKNADRKKEALTKLVAQYEKRSGDSAPEAIKHKFDNDFQATAREFCGIPFDPAACPEHAEEIATLYKGRVLPAKKDVRLKTVAEEIEQRCLPTDSGAHK